MNTLIYFITKLFANAYTHLITVILSILIDIDNIERQLLPILII